MMYPLVVDLADDGFPVSVTCRVQASGVLQVDQTPLQ